MTYLTRQNFTREQWQHEVAKILRGFVLVLFWNLVFICKDSQSTIIHKIFETNSSFHVK